MEEEPEEAVSQKSSGTFLSGLSDCSNLTFRKVQRFWESNSAAHKEVSVTFIEVMFSMFELPCTPNIVFYRSVQCWQLLLK